MPIRQTLPLALAATLVCAALPLSAARADDGVTFRDVLKPGGQERTKAQKLADGDACGTYGPTHTIPFMPVFEKCMNAKGWVLDHYTTNDPRPAAGDTNTHYVDIKGDGRDHERGNAALQVDTRTCKATAKTDKAVNACLADHGWQIMLTQHGPPLPRTRVVSTPPSQPSWGWSSGSPDTSSDDSIRRDEEIRRNDESNRQIQQSVDTINQAIQSANDQAAAAALQVQIDNNIANMPTFGQ
jgi:hypothetical protein